MILRQIFGETERIILLKAANQDKIKYDGPNFHLKFQIETNEELSLKLSIKLWEMSSTDAIIKFIVLDTGQQHKS